jgi:L-threonylcarbamoyladenylate synthase
VTVRVPLTAPEQLPAAVAAVREALAGGHVIAIPTESSYGLAVDPRNATAVERVFRLKGRPARKPLPVLAASLEQAEGLVAVPEPWRLRLTAAWPAPLTVVLPVLAGGGRTLAVRVPAHALLRAVLARVGPLTATSANPSGAEPALTADEVEERLGDVGLIVDGGRTPGGPPSTLIDASVTPPRLIRQGRWRCPRGWGVKTA